MQEINLRRISSICILLTSIIASQATILSPEAALARVVVSDGYKGKRALSSGDANRFRHVYTEASSAYYVFDKNRGGYMVVSADDEFPALLAEVESGSYCTDSLAPGAEWLLDEYAKAISKRVTSSTGGLSELYGRWDAISPLVSTRWNQSWPYNIMCPEKNGQNCVTGCVATAMAQVIRTIGYAECSGYLSNNSGDERVDFDFSSAQFDFDIMPDEPSINDSAEALNAVASLMLACGLSVYMNYDTDMSGAYVENVVPALVERFGYSADYTRLVQRQKFTVAQWESMLYRELSIGRPVIYRGQSSSSGHAFVIDGYAPSGRWHVNWGWGGMSDGYYNLSILSPSQQGIGGSTSAEGYNSNQAMVIAVKPGADPGIIMGAVGGSVSAGDSDSSVSLYYQSMGNTLLDLSLGVVITDETGVIEKGSLTLWEHQSLSASASIRINNKSLDITSLTLQPGSYRIYPGYALSAGSQLQIAESCDGRQYFANLTVNSDGTYIINNVSFESRKSQVLVSEMSGGPLHAGYNVKLRVVFVNDGDADYKGTIYANIMADGSDEVIRRVTASNVFISSEMNTDIEYSVPGVDSSGIPLTAGHYHIRFSDSEGNEIANNEWDIEVVTGAPKTYQETRSDISIHNAETISKMMMIGETWTHVPDAYVDRELTSGDVCVAFYRPSTNVKIKSYTVKKSPISRVNGNMSIDRFTIDVPPGFYEVAYEYDRTQVSGRQKAGVGKVVDGISYVPTSTTEVAVVASADGMYEGHVVIPESVELDGVKYIVTSVADNAFGNCSGLLSVEIPSTIKNIGRNGLAYCAAMESVTFKGATIPFIARNHAMPGLNEWVEVYVNPDAYDDYNDCISKYNEVYASIDSIGSAKVTMDEDEKEVVLNISPSHPSINRNFALNVADASSDIETASPVATAEIKEVNADGVTIVMKPLQCGTTRFLLQSAQRGVSPGELIVTVPVATSIVETEGYMFDSGDEKWFDIQGNPIRNRNAFTHGIVIIKRRNGKVAKVAL